MLLPLSHVEVNSEVGVVRMLVCIWVINRKPPGEWYMYSAFDINLMRSWILVLTISKDVYLSLKIVAQGQRTVKTQTR
jgi:hypothetical protein